MEQISTFRPVSFDEEYYTIPEAIKKIDDAFNLSIPIKTVNGKKRLDRSANTYKTVYQHIRREIKKLNLTNEKYIKNEHGSNTKYSRLIWNLTVNEALYPWLCEMSKKEEYKKFEEWRRREKEYGHRQARMIGLAEQADMSQETESSGLEDAIEAEIQNRKLAIISDFICSHLISLDEELLRKDVEFDFFLDDVAPSAYGLMVHERLTNPKNYYSVKKCPTPTVFK